MRIYCWKNLEKKFQRLKRDGEFETDFVNSSKLIDEVQKIRRIPRVKILGSEDLVDLNRHR